ncbi:thioredoxin [Mycoplasma testudineum]|uniref:Thioredoxin n=1 Tax=Mycoplasma testudineum TaxID=244584 RepID=A0A4R6IE03_9MOLU|nr:thioredoxin family protein [Mycoplasma testudineum]OYD26954.1 hypothetical protein CG473_01285 [Mycoplasma testudineum]TDO20503.1 thioredoxin [Mycoplasma testudineum]
MIKENLTRAEIDSAITSGTSLLYFYSKNCGPCLVTQKIMEQISSEYNATIFKVDSDIETKWTKELSITSIPMTFLVKDGQILNKIVGLTSKHEFVKMISQYL